MPSERERGSRVDSPSTSLSRASTSLLTACDRLWDEGVADDDESLLDAEDQERLAGWLGLVAQWFAADDGEASNYFIANDILLISEMAEEALHRTLMKRSVKRRGRALASEMNRAALELAVVVNCESRLRQTKRTTVRIEKRDEEPRTAQ